MDDYEKSKAFWNDAYAGDAPEAMTARAFSDETFYRLTSAGLSGADTVLDYGCGSGWGLFEMYYTRRFKEGLGIDASENGVRYANRCAQMSGLSGVLRFERGDIDLLTPETYDFILSVNLLDVVPKEACERILAALYQTLKKGKHILVCLNPEFTEDELTHLIGMEKRGYYYYKNGILRARSMETERWKELFGRYFAVSEVARFALTEREKEHPRVAYLMRKEA